MYIYNHITTYSSSSSFGPTSSAGGAPAWPVQRAAGWASRAAVAAAAAAALLYDYIYIYIHILIFSYFDIFDKIKSENIVFKYVHYMQKCALDHI